MRKTIDVDKIRDYANGYLSAKGGTTWAREAIIRMVEMALMESGNYKGFEYLAQDRLDAKDKPGIRPEDVEGYRFYDTDATRVRYS